eukprot:2372091-Karenia_brevis.AAC.1
MSRHPEVVALAQSGNQGQYPANCLRDILHESWMVRIPLPKAIQIGVPLVDKSREPETAVWAI